MAKVVMTNQEAGDFWVALNSSLLAKLKGVKFAYAIAKNKASLKNIIDVLEEMQKKEAEKTKEFEEKRIELCKLYADKDDNGNPRMISGNTQFVINENKEKFDDEVSKLKEKYKEQLDERDEFGKKFEEILKEKVEVDVYMLKEDDIPNDISVEQMSNIFWMIEELTS